ncbi:MAG: UPF0104 family protein [Chitinophagia bacterium]|nr:UPF0104 family protein [Chitinophagia bacterium]
MKKILITILKYIVFLGAGIWIIYFMLSQLKPQERADLFISIKTIHAWYIVPITLFGILSHYIRAIRWKYLLATIDLKPTNLNLFFAVMIGYATNLIVPRGGEVAKCTVLAKYENMPVTKMVGTIFAERAFDLLCLLLITAFAFFMEMKRIEHYFSVKFGLIIDKIYAHRTIAIIALALMAIGMAAFIFFSSKNKESKIIKLFSEMLQGILSIFRMKNSPQFLLYTVLLWFFYGAQLYLGLLCVPATAHLPAMAAIVVLAYGSFAVIATPGGIGAYTYMVAEILSTYNITPVPAQAFGWVAWALQTLLVIVFGLLSLLLLDPYNKRIHAKQSAV